MIIELKFNSIKTDWKSKTEKILLHELDELTSVINSGEPNKQIRRKSCVPRGIQWVFLVRVWFRRQVWSGDGFRDFRFWHEPNTGSHDVRLSLSRPG